MNKIWHNFYRWTMALIVIAVGLYLGVIGYEYYQLPQEERFYHPRHDWFKPSGIYGHGLGIIGTFLMFIGVAIYIARKRYNFMARYIRIKYLLEFHIFLCVLGPLLIVYHTAFKFGGIVSIAFWCMVAVVASGVIGRFIYIQIPRTIEGRALSINELKMLRMELNKSIKNASGVGEQQYATIQSHIQDITEDDKAGAYIAKLVKRNSKLRRIKKILREGGIPRKEVNAVLSNINEEISLTGKIERLNTMQKLFKYWHVAHLPFALIMLIIVILHVVVTLAFGYKWIF